MKEVTDELIATYLSGNATEEESTMVEDYFAESEENMDDLMAIADAIRIHRKATSSQHRSMASTLMSQKRNQQSTVPKRRRSIVRYAVAASVVPLLAAGGIGIWLALRGTSEENLVAWNEPSSSMISDIQQEETNDKNTANTAQVSYMVSKAPVYAEATTTPTSETKEQEEETAPTSVEQQLISEKEITGPEVRMAASRVTTAPKNDEEKTATSHPFNPKVPSKWLNRGDLTIHWESDATSVTVELESAKGYRMNETFNNTKQSVTYPASVRERFLEDGGYINVILTALFSDNKKITRTKVIELKQ